MHGRISPLKASRDISVAACGCSWAAASDTAITVGWSRCTAALLMQHCAAAFLLQQATQPSKWVDPYTLLPSLTQDCAAHLGVKTATVDAGDSVLSRTCGMLWLGGTILDMPIRTGRRRIHRGLHASRGHRTTFLQKQRHRSGILLLQSFQAAFACALHAHAATTEHLKHPCLQAMRILTQQATRYGHISVMGSSFVV